MPGAASPLTRRNKRQQVALCEEFARRYGSKGVGFYSMHPGWVDTPGLQSSMPSFYRQFEKQLRTLPQGTDTISYLVRSAWCGRRDER